MTITLPRSISFSYYSTSSYCFSSSKTKSGGVGGTGGAGGQLGEGQSANGRENKGLRAQFSVFCGREEVLADTAGFWGVLCGREEVPADTAGFCLPIILPLYPSSLF